MDPLSILPAEMWQQIFANVRGSRDWLNLYRASPSFQEIVGKERHQALFPQVLPLVVKYLAEKYKSFLNIVLTLRLVSHKWREGVDSLMKGNTSPGTLFWERSACRYKYVFKNVEKIDSFLKQFGAHSSWSPIVGGHVKLICGGDDAVVHTRSVTPFMIKFGTGITSLCLEVVVATNPEQRTYDEFGSQLGSIIEQAPNLNQLDITLDLGTEAEADLGQELSLVYNVARTTLANLKSFDIITSRRSRSEESRGSFARLRLCSSPNSQFVRYVEKPVGRTNTKGIMTTGFGLHWDDNMSSVGMGQVFRAAQHFKQNLTSLVVFRNNVEVADDGDNSGKFVVDLPRLKSLQLNRMLKLSGNLPNLQVIIVWDWKNRPTRGSRMPVYSGRVLEREVFQSRSWQVIPKLKAIVVLRAQLWKERFVAQRFSREQYKAYWAELATQVGEHHSWHLAQKVADKTRGLE